MQFVAFERTYIDAVVFTTVRQKLMAVVLNSSLNIFNGLQKLAEYSFIKPGKLVFDGFLT